MDNTEKPRENKVNCDQVVWLMAVFDRYLPKNGHPGISKQREMMIYGMLYEVIDILNMEFSDGSAVKNATPVDVRILDKL